MEYLEANEYNLRYQKCMLSYLDKYVKAISSPMDVVRCFNSIKKGKRNLWLGLRVLFNYLESVGYNKDFLDALRKAMPKVQCGIDLQIPDEASLMESMRKLSGIPKGYDALYNLLLDSGLRLIEAVKVLNEFKDAEKINGFYRANVGMFRGSKQAYYAYFTEATYQKIQQAPREPIKPINASHYYDKKGFISPKYLRKFAFDKMIELEIPESVADFIEGRVAKRIGAKHYMALARQANGFYGKYAEYLNGLRARLYRK
jgi:intergrase/recombinase